MVKVLDSILPFLSPAEQVIYFRLWRMSEEGVATARYEDVAKVCNLSISTFKRGLAKLVKRGLVEVTNYPKAPSMFMVNVVSLDPEVKLDKWYDQLEPEDRADFLILKRSLGNQEIEQLKKEADERGVDVDALIFIQTFGPARQRKYEHLL